MTTTHNVPEAQNYPNSSSDKKWQDFLEYSSKNPEKFIEWIEHDPRYKDIVAKAKEKKIVISEEPSLSKNISFFLRYLLIVPPNSLYGRVKVNPQLVMRAKAVAAVQSVSNIWDTLTAVPLAYLSVGGGPLGFFFAALITVIAQTFSNKTAEIAAVGCHKHQRLAGGATFGCVAMSALLTLISGYGSDIVTNGTYLAEYHADKIVKENVLPKYERNLRTAETKVKDAQKLIQKCDEQFKEWQSLPKSSPGRDAFYRKLNGPFGVKPSYWDNQPTAQLPLCPRSLRLEHESKEEIAKAQKALNQTKSNIDEAGKPIVYLQQFQPKLYASEFTEQGNIRSGVKTVEIAITSFNQRLLSGNLGSLGFSLIGLGISVITTVGAVAFTMIHRRLPSVADTFDRSLHNAQEEFFHAVGDGLRNKQGKNNSDHQDS